MTRSPTLMTLGPAFPPAIDEGRKESFSPLSEPLSSRQEAGQFSCAQALRDAYLLPPHLGPVLLLLRRGEGHTLLNAEGSEGQGLPSSSPDPMRLILPPVPSMRAKGREGEAPQSPWKTRSSMSPLQGQFTHKLHIQGQPYYATQVRYKESVLPE